MTTFLALYRGNSIPEAEIIAVTTEQTFCREVAERLLRTKVTEGDPVLGEIKGGRERALQIIAHGEKRKKGTPNGAKGTG